jgi:hypothetical protein
MDDPRWDDVREREDARAQVYEQRDRTDDDPRDGLMHGLDLPRGDARASWWSTATASTN